MKILKYLIFFFIPLLSSAQDTILVNKYNSPYFITEDLHLSDSDLMVIEKGSEIILSDSVNIYVSGKLEIRGTKNNPVTLKTKNDTISWGRIIIKSKHKTIIRNTNIINGAITAHDSKIYVANSNFYYYEKRKFDGWPVFYIFNSNTYFLNNILINYTGRYVGEGINFIEGEVNCANNYIKDFNDAIEFTRINNSVITGNHIVNSWDDAIDINASSDLEISYNLIENIDDKGISIGGDQNFTDKIKAGRSKNITISNNIIRKVKIGISVSDSSQAKIKKNIITDSNIAFKFYEKTKNTGGAFVSVDYNILVNNKEDKIKKNSRLKKYIVLSDKKTKNKLKIDSVNYYITTNNNEINPNNYYRLNYIDTSKIISDTILPIMFINTFPKTIIDDERINAEYQIFSKSKKINSGSLSIEIRGSSSSAFPKKSFGITTNKAKKLLGLPKDKDWVLYGPYYDLAMIRNSIAFSLSSKTSIKSPKYKFLKLFINGEDKALYVLIQKIKKSENFINVEKLSKTDTAEKNITGGYIFKIDKGTGANNNISLSNSKGNGRVSYYSHYPKPKNINNQQERFLINYIKKFEDNLLKTPVNLDVIDINSFIDYILINELMKNFDAYRASIYFYKFKYNDKIFIGPVWDFNMSSGNSYEKHINDTADFILNIDYSYRKYTPVWWYNLISDSTFSTILKARWHFLREKGLSDESINNLIKDLSTQIGTYNNEVQVDFLNKWLISRAKWLDENINIIDETAKQYIEIQNTE